MESNCNKVMNWHHIGYEKSQRACGVWVGHQNVGVYHAVCWIGRPLKKTNWGCGIWAGQ